MTTTLTEQSLKSAVLPTWCPGCGNFAILTVVKRVLTSMQFPEEDLAVVYGIGCGGNGADFSRVYGLHALHGRAIANAVGIKLSNHRLKVLVLAGDGDLYGEGLNHLVAAARGNHDLTVIVHNNQMYSLTTGQSSPTTAKGTKSKSTPHGVVETEINPLAVTIAAGASFVARAYAGQAKQMTDILTQAINHRGFSLVDILQPCPTFNKGMSYQWYQQRVYDLATTGYQPFDRVKAMEQAWEQEKMPIGIFYHDKNSQAYHQQVGQIATQTLLEQFPKKVNLVQAMSSFR